MSAVNPQPSPERRRREGRFLALLHPLWLRLWTRLFLRRYRVAFGGVITERLSALDLDDAVPPDVPTLEGVEPQWEWGAETSELLNRATMWGIALEAADRLARDLFLRKRVLTTYGFARVHGRVRLAVIRYLPLRVLPDARKVEPVSVEGRSFPVVLRSWSPEACRDAGEGAGARAGTCWVRFDGIAGGSRRGILTAAHALEPPGCQGGMAVSIASARIEPAGRLHACSAVMDAAIVDVSEDDGTQPPWRISQRIGYKPVRLLSRRGPVDTDITEISGVVRGTILGARGQEPVIPVVLALGEALRKGDSGCLGLDLEPLAFGGEPAPYLLYRGRFGVKVGNAPGYATPLEQVRRVWDFEVLRRADRHDEGAMR